MENKIKVITFEEDVLQIDQSVPNKTVTVVERTEKVMYECNTSKQAQKHMKDLYAKGFRGVKILMD